MQKLGLHGCLKAKKGQGDQLASILLKSAEELRNAKGCHLYMVSIEKDFPDNIWVTELWDSKADHQNSLQLESVRALIGEAMPLLDETPKSGQKLTVLGGLGV